MINTFLTNTSNIVKIVLFAIFFMPLGMSGQHITKTELSPKEQKLFTEAKKESQKGNFKKSNDKYLSLLELQPQFIEGILRLANNYYDQNEIEKATYHFNEAIKINPDYDPEMYYSLGNVHAKSKNYGLAAKNYGIFLEKSPDTNAKTKKAKTNMDNMLFAEYAVQHPVPFRPISLGSHINTTFSEYSPYISLDGKTLIFTRNVGQEDLYIAKWDSLDFKKAQVFSGINTPQNEGAFTISANGNFLVFTACDRRDAIGGCDLYYSSYENNKWTTPVNMGHVVNSAAWDSQPTLSADGRTLYFASNRLGTYGQSDIWMTYRNIKNAWMPPTNLGPSINTSGNDESPFLHPDSQTLYFRSDGRPGMGGFDIFFSRLDLLHQEWSEPKNLGYPINTEGQEGAFIVGLDGTKAYFTSDKDYQSGGFMNQLDLYSIDLYPEARPLKTTFVKGYVKDIQTQMPLLAEVVIKDLKTQELLFQSNTDENGYFISSLPAGRNYACIVNKVHYAYYAQNFDLTDTTHFYKPYELAIWLQPLPSKEDTTVAEYKPIVLENIFFELGSSELKPESALEIATLSALLQANIHLHILIIGHTDDIGEVNDNLLLSQNRAKTVANELIKSGIDPTRISSEGKGESMPIDTNKTPEGRQKNRRTEFILSYHDK